MSEPSNRKAIRRRIYGAFFDRVIPRGGKGAVKRSPHGAFADDINDMRQIIGIMGTTAAITPPLRTLTSGGVTCGVVHWALGWLRNSCKRWLALAAAAAQPTA